MIIDVHAHYVPRALALRLLERPLAGVSVVQEGANQFRFVIGGEAPTRLLPAKLIDLEQRVVWMADRGIDIQVLTTWADIFGYGLEPEHATLWSDLLNATLMESITDWPQFAALASLPMQEPDAAAAVMSRALNDGFHGVTIGTRIAGVELDDPRLQPFWEAASSLGAVVFVHPSYGVGDPRMGDYGLINAVGRGLDTTVTAARLLCAGIPTRFAGARILLAHGGGTLPYLMGRLRRNYELDTSLGDPEEGFSRLLFDSVVFDPVALSYLCELAARGSILLGSDYPFPIGDPHPLRVVDEANLPTRTRDSILGVAAVRTLGLGTSA